MGSRPVPLELHRQPRALELRDQERALRGQGVLKAVEHINTEISEAIMGLDAQTELHRQDLIELGRDRHSRASRPTPFSRCPWRSRSGGRGIRACRSNRISAARRNAMPVPMMNVINGGAHASNN